MAIARAMCHVGTKSARPLSLLHPSPSGTDSNRAPSSLLFRLEQKQERWRKLLIPLTSRTLAARRGAPSTNSLAGLDAHLHCAPSRQTTSPRNSQERGTQGRGRDSTRLNNKQLPHLGKIPTTVCLNPLGRRGLLLPFRRLKQGKTPQLDSISRSLYSTPGQLSNLGFATSSLPACANSKFQRSGAVNQ